MIREAFEAIQQRISKNVHLLAVSKGQPTQKIKALYELGQRDFGENYALELKTKQGALKDKYQDIKWHFIGQIQSNKIKIIASAHMVHTLSNSRHAKLLAEATPYKRLPVFIQINLSEDPNRGGVFPKDLNSLIKAVKSLHKLELMGLMTILPIIPKKPASYWFKQMQELQAPEYKELSMGMSEDFEEAIACGATWVRVGSALFGPRPPDLSCWPTPASLR